MDESKIKRCVMKNNSLWSDAIYRLSMNRAAMLGGLILVMLVICAVLAPWIAPYSYSFQDLNLSLIHISEPTRPY